MPVLKSQKRLQVALIIITLTVLLLAKGTLFYYSIANINHDHAVAVSQDYQRVVYLGGMPVGLSVKSDGVIVTSLIEVETDYGRVTPKSGIEDGDIITEINGKRILTSDDLNSVLRAYTRNCLELEIKLIRDTKEKYVTAFPVIEQYSGYYRLGVVTRDFAEGVGTITFIRPCGEFASLGHPINSSGGSRIIPCYGGNAFECVIVGYNRGRRGNPGELRGIFANQSSPKGSLHTNSRFGVFGKLNKVPLDKTEPITIAKRNHVKPGKAEIVSTVGDETKRYSIQIIKTTSQNSPQERGIVFKVTDKELLNKTGGIVQGMSGSPIIQNGKLVGAVTHVFLNDPTRGYGVYLDFMYT